MGTPYHQLFIPRVGQTLYTFVMILIPLIPILALVVQNIVLLTDIIER